MKITDKILPPESAPGIAGRRAVYPLVAMKVGESFRIRANGKPIERVRNKIHAAISGYRGRWGWSRKYITAIEGRGIRVWRVK